MANVSSSNGLEKRPKLRFPGFDEPWANQTFSSIFSFLQNNTLSRAELDATGEVLNIHYGDVLIKYGSVLDASDKAIPHIVSGNESPNYVYLQDGDIVIADTAEDETVGKATELFNVSENKIEAGLHTIPCRPIIPFAPMYLGYYMNTPYYHKQLIPLMQGIKVLSVSKGNISKTEISAPKTIDEQQKISFLLHLIDQRAAIQSKVIETLKKYKRGVISVPLSSKNNPYYSSETWKEVALCDVASGFEYGMNAAATVYDGSHKYIRITDIDDNSHLYSQDVPVSPEGQVDEKYRVRENDILFARTGASVGKSYRYQRSDGDLYYAGFLIRIHVNSDVNCGYVFQNTLTEAYRRWVLLESARSGQPGINAEQYKQYRFLLPPLEIQNKISTLATNLDNLICKEENLLSQVEQAKIALLQRLFI